MDNQTYPINSTEIELMHRVFGGTKIICKSVRTINTGGGVMNDLYDTECGKLVVVYEYGAIVYESFEHFNDGVHIAQFSWDMPLYSITELQDM